MSENPIDPHAHHYAHCLPFGAQLLGPKGTSPRTRFRFWAPSCKSVQVEIENGPAKGAHEMTPAGNGWFVHVFVLGT